mmetsp:Transcript_58277/g.173437  ORF Transcript_58277/g.173437 Transcript_58277/m.173437 type:complete len:220 (-) Transcript_58277:460-1119(-)
MQPLSDRIPHPRNIAVGRRCEGSELVAGHASTTLKCSLSAAKWRAVRPHPCLGLLVAHHANRIDLAGRGEGFADVGLRCRWRQVANENAALPVKSSERGVLTDGISAEDVGLVGLVAMDRLAHNPHSFGRVQQGITVFCIRNALVKVFHLVAILPHLFVGRHPQRLAPKPYWLHAPRVLVANGFSQDSSKCLLVPRERDVADEEQPVLTLFLLLWCQRA